MSSANKKLKCFESIDSFGKRKPVNIGLMFITSSHGAPHHHLQEPIQQALEDEPRFSHSPIFNWRSGGLINASVVENIKESVNSNKNQPQVVVLILGGNNLRDLSRVGSTQPQTPLEVTGLFREVLNHCSSIPKCWVVIVGLHSLMEQGMQATIQGNQQTSS